MTFWSMFWAVTLGYIVATPVSYFLGRLWARALRSFMVWRFPPPKECCLDALDSKHLKEPVGYVWECPGCHGCWEKSSSGAFRRTKKRPQLSSN